MLIHRFIPAFILLILSVGSGPIRLQESGTSAKQPAQLLDYIDTSFENASPVWYETAADGTINIHLLYDHERESPNRAAGHIHMLLRGRPGAKLTLEFKNLENIYNGRP